MFHLCVTRPSEIFVNVLLNIFTLLEVTQSLDNWFHSFIVLCEKNYCLYVIYTVPSITSLFGPLVLLSEKKYFYQYFHTDSIS